MTIFSIDERHELIKTINYSRGKIEDSKENLLNQLAVKINFGSDSFSEKELLLILRIIGMYLNQAESANSSHIALYHRIDCCHIITH